MRKIEVISIVTFLVISALSLYKLNTKRIVPSEFLLRNVEALAIEEGNQYMCIGSGTLTCPVTGMKVKHVIKMSK